jgi:triacylglycerol lipase
MKIHSSVSGISVADLSFAQRSLLFAELANIAYQDPTFATKIAKQIGFTRTKYYDRDGAQAYWFANSTDVVIACRGTQPTEFNDLAADLRAAPVKSESVSRVHRGFKQEVDDLWPVIREDVLQIKKQTLWFCGHSLGAAMATIMASRCMHDGQLIDPHELYTYGSPRVGWRGFIQHLSVPHHRWVNNNDIVTTVPPCFIGYRHDGEEHYLNAYGKVRKHTAWQRTKDRWRGLILGLKTGSIDSFSDHSIGLYCEYIKGFVDEEKVCK